MRVSLFIAPSGTGYQASILGLLGILAAQSEGLELNLLGLVIGLDPLSPAVKLPGIGWDRFRSRIELLNSDQTVSVYLGAVN